MNKKGMISPLVIILVIVVGLVAFLASPTIRFTLIGISIIGVTLIFIAPAALSGDFTREKTIFLIIMIFIGGVIIAIPYTGIIQQVGQGPSILSIDKIDNVGKESEFLITSTIGSAERLRIDWSADEINEEMEKENLAFRVNRGVVADIELTDWKHKFPITLTDNIFYSLITFDTSPYIGWESSCDLNDCSDNNIPLNLRNKNNIFINPDDAIGGSAIFLPRCNCTYVESIAKVGKFLGGKTFLDYNIKFLLDGEVANMNKDNRVISLKSGKFRAEEVGILGTLESLSPPQYDVLWQNAEYKYLIPSNGYSLSDTVGSLNNPKQYLESCTDLLSLPSNDYNRIEPETFESCKIQYQNLQKSGMTNKTNEYKINNQLDNVNIEGENLVVKPAINQFKPVFKIFINAAWVGLEELSGEPEIISCVEDSNIVGGTVDAIKIKVKNIGDNDGHFDYGVKCDDKTVDILGGGDGMLVKKDTSAEFILSFEGTNPEKTTDLEGKCIHTITDRKSQISKTCTSSYKVEHSTAICISDTETRCEPNSNNLQICDSSGIKWIDKSNCECVVENKVAQCSDGDKNGSDEDKLDCPIYQQEISTSETDYGILGWRKLFNMGKTVESKKCVTNSTFVLILLLSTILIFTVIITTALKKPKKKGRK